jgi:hypothetical protein
MKKAIFALLVLFALLALFLAAWAVTKKNDGAPPSPIPVAPEKPVIYLYPPEETAVTVILDYDGVLDFAYPKYNGGWRVLASPDGTLIDCADGKQYSSLFWEGHGNTELDLSCGFVVAGDDTVAFLQEKLSFMGLNQDEINEFIIYWGPRLQPNEYNLLAFQGESYTNAAKLSITPEPDSILRIFMAYQPLLEKIEVPAQELFPFERAGFVVIEWGGCEIAAALLPHTPHLSRPSN